MPRLAAILIILSVVVLRARADEDERDAMAEPIVGESITDIDGDEPGEAEVDVTAQGVRQLDGDNLGASEVELELKLTRRLGVSLSLEPSGDQTRAVAEVGLRAGASFSLLHDWRHDFHVMLEVSALVFGDELAKVKDDASGANYFAGVRTGWRHEWFTLRTGFGLALAGVRPVPLWAALALLGEWGHHGRRSFAGLDIVSDWSSNIPLDVIPELGIGFELADMPFRIAVGVPIQMGYRRADWAFGGLLRLILEIEPPPRRATS